MKVSKAPAKVFRVDSLNYLWSNAENNTAFYSPMTIAKKTITTVGLITLAFAILGLCACGGSKDQSTKPVGPSDDVIRVQIDEVFKMAGEAAGQKVEYKISDIARGDVLESQGAPNIPAGTKMFPIKTMISVRKGSDMTEPQPMEWYFFKDSYGKWQSLSKQ